MSPFRDTAFGRMRPKFKCTVYLSSGRWQEQESRIQWIVGETRMSRYEGGGGGGGNEWKRTILH